MPLKSKPIEVQTYYERRDYQPRNKTWSVERNNFEKKVTLANFNHKYTERVLTLESSNTDNIINTLWECLRNNEVDLLRKQLRADFFESFDEAFENPNFHLDTSLHKKGNVTRSQTGQYRPVIEYLALNHLDELKEMLDFARRNLKNEEAEINEDASGEKEKEKLNDDDKVIIKIKPTTLSALLNSFSSIKLGRNEKIEFGDMDLTDVSFKGAKLGRSDLSQAIGGDFSGCDVSRCEMKDEQKTVAVVQTLFDALYKHSFKTTDDKQVKIQNLRDNYRNQLNGPERRTAMERLHAEFTKLIDRKVSGTDYDSVLSIHRKPWLDIATEIVTALGLFLAGGVPVLGYFAVASYNAYKTGRFGLFPETTSVKMVKEMDNELVKRMAPSPE